MALRFVRLGLALASVCVLSACAVSVDNTSGGEGGSGGAGASGGSGGAGGSAGDGGMGGGGEGGASASSSASSSDASSSSASSSSASSGSGGNPNCGNGVLDPGEQCDGTDFGGKTCESIGLGTGNLNCNTFCGIVATNCVPKETCGDFQDNDEDGLSDCEDSDCFMQAVCLDSCYSPKLLTVPGWFSGDTTGRPNNESASCSSMSGPEAIFQVKAPQSGTLTASINAWSGVDFSISLRSACSDVANELACANNKKPNGGSEFEQVSVEAVQGQTYFVVVEGVDQGAGYFDLQVDMILPEETCDDFYDDDVDGYIDCDDPTTCQSTFYCQPGPGQVGDPCSFSPSECAANNNDPVCLRDYMGYPNGYCSEWCDIAAQDCPSGAICVDMGLKSVNGVCLQSCTTDTDCHAGYVCLDTGFSTKVCLAPPEQKCDNAVDDDSNGFIDCEDLACQTTPECQGGVSAPGLPCTASNQCAANKNDPICLSEDNYGFPGGYCSEFCNMASDDCPTGTFCAQWFNFPSSATTCLRKCTTNAQCRVGYTCLDVGLNGMKGCVY